MKQHLAFVPGDGLGARAPYFVHISVGALLLLMALSNAKAAAGVPVDEKAKLGLDANAALRISQAALGNQISDFTLLDREGRTVRLSQYRGKPLLVSMVYTGCFQACPTATRQLQEALQAGQANFDTRQFNVISIGFNQPEDTPQALKSFALQHRLSQPNWDFLSPHATIVAPLARELGFSYLPTAAGIDHVSQVTLLDAQGRIYRQIYGQELQGQALPQALKELLNEAPVAQSVLLADLINRVRVLCTVYDPVTGSYRVQYGLLIEVAGGVTFVLAMVWFFMAEWLDQRRSRRRKTPTLASDSSPTSTGLA